MDALLNPLLIEYNSLGIIPGPAESEEEFMRRAESCLALRQRIATELGSTIPLKPEELAPLGVLSKPLEKTQKLWGIRPDWVPVFFSNYQLLPWHGGCAWIFQLKADEPPLALLQLRRTFAKSEAYLRIYHRDELVEHELSHVGRMCFHEPRFEEIFAYQSSRSWFRRWFGPLFQSSIETVSFLVALLFILGVDAYVLTAWGHAAYSQVASLKLLPAVMLAFALGRLMHKQWQFRRCLNNLTAIFKDETRAHQMIYRLTDSEIAAFKHKQTILSYAKQQASSSLRWRVLNAVYFSY